MRYRLYAFDDERFPGISGLRVRMESPLKSPLNPIVSRGEPGAPDARRAQCAAVLREERRWRMWYVAHDEEGQGRVALAESDDGLHWHKPHLGLVDYRGNRQNNLVAAQPGLNTVSVIHCPDAPAPHRYVLVGEDMRHWRGWTLAGPSCARIDVSPDGLHWTPIQDGPGPIQPQFEAMTLYRFQQHYHIGGHQIAPLLQLPLQADELGGYLGPRTFVVWRSPVLDRWPVENTRAFFKPLQSSSPYRPGWDREEVHLGAAVSVFDDVCLGLYGQWHHPLQRTVTPEEVARLRETEGGHQQTGNQTYFGPEVSVDLGLLFSNDGLHFRDPAPGHTFIRRDQEAHWDREFKTTASHPPILLLQGSMINTPDQTYIFYSASTPHGNTATCRGNIGLATLPRDRFGYVECIPGQAAGSLLSVPLTASSSDRLWLNAEAPPGSTLRISLMDADGLNPLPGYEMRKRETEGISGLNVEVRWSNETRTRPLPKNPFRIRLELTPGAKFYALGLSAHPCPS